MSSGVRFSPVCQGQAPGYAISPPTMRLGFLTPQVREDSVGPGTVGGTSGGDVEEGGGKGGPRGNSNVYKYLHMIQPLFVTT